MRSKDLLEPDPLMVSNDVPEQAWDDVRQASVHREQWKFLRENLKLQLEKLQKCGGDSRIIEGVNKDSFQEGN